MTKRQCATGRTDCPHEPACIWDCAYESGMVLPVVRKVKPYPVVPDDIEEVPESWHTIGTVMLTAIFAALAVVCILMFFTGFWIWSLLI